MSFPLNAFQDLSLEMSLVLSVLIGIGFGFMLERGGFGSSRILAGIFYGRDWRVLKVMFSAIVTAMLGLYALQGLGLVVMEQVAFRPTYLGGQVVGGLLLGIGFVTAGYCPGTSVVGLVSGKIDALLVLVGVFLGIGFFEEMFSSFAAVRDWGSMGRIGLSDWLGVPTGVVVLAVAAMALMAFSVVGWFERRSSRARLTFTTMSSATALVVGGVLVAMVQFMGPGEARAMTRPTDARAMGTAPEQLAAWVVEGRSDFLVLDLRPEGSQPELPGSWTVAAAVLLDQRQCPELPLDRPLLVVDLDGDGMAQEVTANLRTRGHQATFLDGGVGGWKARVLSEEGIAVEAASYRMMMEGSSPILDGAAPPPMPTKRAAPVKKKSKKGGC